MAHEQVLADTEFFADAPASMLADVAASGKIRNLVRGDVLFEAGDDPDSIYECSPAASQSRWVTARSIIARA
jgi:hypothetical protein